MTWARRVFVLGLLTFGRCDANDIAAIGFAPDISLAAGGRTVWAAAGLYVVRAVGVLGFRLRALWRRHADIVVRPGFAPDIAALAVGQRGSGGGREDKRKRDRK